MRNLKELLLSSQPHQNTMGKQRVVFEREKKKRQAAEIDLGKTGTNASEH